MNIKLVNEANAKLAEMLKTADTDLKTFLKSNKCKSKHEMIMKIIFALMVKEAVAQMK